MKKLTALILLALTLLLSFAVIADAATRVKGYTRKSTGTYVAPHYRSNTDSKKYNNYSSKGNYNPYTGKKGYKKY